MNTPDNVWKQLAQAARKAPVSQGDEVPFGFPGRVVAQWRAGERPRPSAWEFLSVRTLAFAALGIALAGYIRSGDGASAVVNAVYLPMSFLSGSFWTPHAYPRFLEVIADILPPPAYILESYLEATLALNNPNEVAGHAQRLATLKREYQERQDYWRQQAIEPQINVAMGSLSGVANAGGRSGGPCGRSRIEDAHRIPDHRRIGDPDRHRDVGFRVADQTDALAVGSVAISSRRREMRGCSEIACVMAREKPSRSTASACRPRPCSRG